MSIKIQVFADKKGKEHMQTAMDVNEPKHKVPSAAKLLGVAEKTLWGWIGDRRVAVYRIGRSVFLGESEINRILTEGFTPARHTA